MKDWPYPNFTKAEVTCKCGCGMLPSHDLMAMLQMLRDRCGFPLIVTSAARCPTHNARVARTGFTGPHVIGLAVDLALSGRRAFEVIGLAIELGFTGIGVKQKGPIPGRFIHLDCITPDTTIHQRPWVWSY
jgi:zinc D-Ala-D-Ala carboxypeptidase